MTLPVARVPCFCKHHVCWVIAISNQKGGTGKSTIATNLAVELKTSLLDLDKQHSSIIFNYKRAHAGLEPLD